MRTKACDWCAWVAQWFRTNRWNCFHHGVEKPYTCPQPLQLRAESDLVIADGCLKRELCNSIFSEVLKYYISVIEGSSHRWQHIEYSPISVPSLLEVCRLCFLKRKPWVLHSGFIFLGTKAINIWRTSSIFIVYLSASKRRPTIMESGLYPVSVIIPVLLILSPEPPCFPLRECKIMTMVRAETFQIFQYDMLALRNYRRESESMGNPWEKTHISCCGDPIARPSDVGSTRSSTGSTWSEHFGWKRINKSSWDVGRQAQWEGF